MVSWVVRYSFAGTWHAIPPADIPSASCACDLSLWLIAQGDYQVETVLGGSFSFKTCPLCCHACSAFCSWWEGGERTSYLRTCLPAYISIPPALCALGTYLHDIHAAYSQFTFARALLPAFPLL